MNNKQYLQAKDDHDCNMNTHGYCKVCQDIKIYELEQDFMLDKKTLVAEEV